MTVEEGVEFFKAVPAIREKLRTLQQVGLGYIHVGQPATTLSGGEAQRVKLAKELSRRATGRTLYILDEPTTGLHFEDVRKLLEVLHALVEQGNTVVVIEHNLDVIKTADWIIDLGPEGGDKGGRIVAAGTPEEVAQVTESYTGQYLAPYLRAAARAGEEAGVGGRFAPVAHNSCHPGAGASALEPGTQEHGRNPCVANECSLQKAYPCAWALRRCRRSSDSSVFSRSRITSLTLGFRDDNWWCTMPPLDQRVHL